VIDAGSTHSQVYVYKWDGSKNNGTAIPEQIYSNRTGTVFLNSVSSKTKNMTRFTNKYTDTFDVKYLFISNNLLIFSTWHC